MSKSLRCAWRRWWLWVLVRRVTRHWPAPWSGSSPPQTGPAVSRCRRCWLHRGPLRTEHWCVDNKILVPSYTSFLISPPPAPLQRKLGSQDVVYCNGYKYCYWGKIFFTQCISIILRLYYIYQLSFEINLKLHLSDFFLVPWIHYTASLSAVLRA